MARTYLYKDIVRLFILRNGEEDIERWIDEVVEILKTKNIKCLKEEDFTYVGENLFLSLERSLSLAENVMVILSEGFLRKGQSMYKFHLALKHSIERQIQFLPVLSMNVTPPPEIDIIKCLRVNFSESVRKDDVDKIEKAIIGQKSVTLSEIEKCLLVCEGKLRSVPPDVKLDLPQTPQFRSVSSVLKEIKNQNSCQENNGNGSKLVEIRKRSKSDVSGMKCIKSVLGCGRKKLLSVSNHLFILRNGEEDIERWIDEVVEILRKKNIRCVKEDYKFVGENLFISLKRSISSAENVMVVLSDGFLRKSQNMYKFHLALKHSIEKQILFLPVLSMNVTPPDEIDILKCLRVNFSESVKKDDVDKIEKAIIGHKSVSLSEIVKCLHLSDIKMRKAPLAVKLDLQQSQHFKRVCSLLKEINNRLSSQEMSMSYSKLVEIRERSKSDVSGMKKGELVSRMRGREKRSRIS